MTAPTPVSAYLHSATMVKAGVFLLIRLSPALSGTEAWFFTVAGAGLATLVLGAFFALFQHDLKGLLAYSTISHLGLITALIGIDTPLAYVAAIFHIVNHAVFKASLFMAAGIVDHETGTRDMRRLSGLRHAMPITATLAIVASAAMAGVPLLNGFLSKEMFFAEAAEYHDGSLLDRSMPWIALVASILAVAYSLRFIHCVFFGPPRHRPAEASPTSRPSSCACRSRSSSIVCLLVGIVPALTIGPYLRTAAVSVLGTDLPEYSLRVWHGLNFPLVMSAIALRRGRRPLCLLSRRISAPARGPPVHPRPQGPAHLRAPARQRLVDLRAPGLPPARHRAPADPAPHPRSRRLRRWPPGCCGAPSASTPRTPPSFDPLFAMLWLTGCACAVAAAWQAKYHRFAALVLVGGTGVVTCLSFVWLSAPDLAVTQLLVEVVTTVLLLLGLRWLPKRNEEIAGDAASSPAPAASATSSSPIACGLGVAGIAYAVMTSPLDRGAADWFLRNAYVEGGGTNVVNVILVDFRGFDTFGEITVLGIVALTVFALLRRFRPAEEAVARPEQQRTQDRLDDEAEERSQGDTVRDYLAVPAVIMRWMFPAIITLSAYLFLRGHDLPGGGFAAGITLAIAFLLQYLGTNVREVEDRLRILPVRWIGLGLLVAAGTGIGSWLFGYPVPDQPRPVRRACR